MASRECQRFSPAQNNFLRLYVINFEALGPHPPMRNLSAFHAQLWQSYRLNFEVPPRFERLIRFVSTPHRPPTSRIIDGGGHRTSGTGFNAGERVIEHGTFRMHECARVSTVDTAHDDRR